MSDLKIAPATAEEFAVAVEWAASEGWNPGLDDMEVFHGADAQGFLIGTRNEEPVSSISVVRYGLDYGFLGFYIVRPDSRGTGTGLATWNAGLAHLQPRAIGLDGVVAQQDNYHKSGFVLTGRNIRHTGVPDIGSEGSGPAGIRPVAASDLPALLAYDDKFFAGPRQTFTSAWVLPQDGVRRRAFIAVSSGEITGYGVIRACRKGYKIGPLFADDEATAIDLFLALCGVTDAGAEVSLDTPEDNPAAIGLAVRFGLEPVFETARMYRGTAPGLPVSSTFGITTFELG
ncbi:Acetyltransferase, GNAT family [hydrothermal vent metagenome]|uniref:Acetyltransferase, GNAT family n=1 Tax=hydrothermal vent metagenome TaxID=652676 RepID=A0A3B0TK11_9ZZZZ